MSFLNAMKTEAVLVRAHIEESIKRRYKKDSGIQLLFIID